jgi:translocator protein
MARSVRLLGAEVPLPVLAGGLLAAYAALVLGGIATTIGPWYESLAKPPWTPPGWLIGAVWWVLFTLLGASVSIAWAARPRPPVPWGLAMAAGANLALNVGWSYAFFTLQQPALARAEIVALLASIVVLMAVVGLRHPTAWLLLVPYLLWTGFAALLNHAIVALN